MRAVRDDKGKLVGDYERYELARGKWFKTNPVMVRRFL